jgi:nucleotide-binding universal stress UspA family protein
MYCDPGTSASTVVANPEVALDATLRRHASASDIERWQWQTKIVKCDDPGDCITREASRYGADLIIMRSRPPPASGRVAWLSSRIGQPHRAVSGDGGPF